MRTRRRLDNLGRRVAGVWAASSAAAWTPASLPSLAAWYTAGPSWCFTDAAGTVPAGDGDLVRVWKDRTASARNLVQGTSGNRPTLALSGGRWFVVFDGTNDSVLYTGAFIAAQPFTAFFAARTGVAAVSENVFDGGATGGRAIAGKLSSGTYRLFAGVSLDGAPADASLHAFTGLFNGESSALRQDAAQVLAGDVDVGVPDAGLRVGANNTGANTFLNGAVAELFFSASDATASFAEAEAYLKAAWGTP